LSTIVRPVWKRGHTASAKELSAKRLRKSTRAAERLILAALAFAQTKEGRKLIREVAESRRAKQLVRDLRRAAREHKLVQELMVTVEKSR
jgi:hypothetical protein